MALFDYRRLHEMGLKEPKMELARNLFPKSRLKLRCCPGRYDRRRAAL
jgi:hypothetical protein